MAATSEVPAVVLAGQPNTGRLHAEADAAYEALIPLAGRPMLGYVLDALHQSGAVGAVSVVGPAVEGATAVAPGDGLFDNLRRGLDGVGGDDPALVVTSDIPLLTGPIVHAFVEAARGIDADIVYPIIPRASVEQTFPGVHRTYFRFREGEFTGGNIFWVRPDAMAGAWPHAEQLLAHRKAPVKLARDIGWLVLVKFLLGRLTLAEVERVASRLLHVRGRGLVFPYPEVGVDVDKPSDFQLVAARLNAGADAVRHA